MGSALVSHFRACVGGDHLKLSIYLPCQILARVDPHYLFAEHFAWGGSLGLQNFFYELLLVDFQVTLKNSKSNFTASEIIFGLHHEHFSIYDH